MSEQTSKPTQQRQSGNNRPSRGRGTNGGGRSGGDRRPGQRSGTPRTEVKPEFDQKTLLVRRVTRVVAGGRRFAFSVTVAIGDKKGRVGIGIGKATDTALAIQKAVHNARAKLITVPLTKSRSIPHQVEAKDSSAVIMMRPNFGKGLVAGSSVRTVLELAGITDVTAKVLSRSRNKLNNARCVVTALRKLS